MDSRAKTHLEGMLETRRGVPLETLNMHTTHKEVCTKDKEGNTATARREVESKEGLGPGWVAQLAGVSRHTKTLQVQFPFRAPT